MNEVDLIDYIMRYESGALAEQAVIQLFQHLIDTDMAWTMQGHYGRTARDLIESGLCMRKALPNCQHIYYVEIAGYAECSDCGEPIESPRSTDF